MRIKNRTINLVYVTIFVFTSGYGLILALGINYGRFLILPISYSNISNIICFTYFLIYLIHGIFIKEKKEICLMPLLKGAVTMCVIVTLLIFHFLLSRSSIYIPGTTSIDWRNLIIHYITPILAIFHWVLFDKKGACKLKDPLLWITIPIGYLIFSLICANDALRYPYYFINPGVVGWDGVFAFVIVLTGFFVTLGYCVYGIDKYLEKFEKRKLIN